MEPGSQPYSLPIRWGIIGLGKIAQKFASDLRLVPTATLVAVASRNRNKAESFAKTHSVPAVFDEYEALVASEQVDIVYIATPHTLHFEHTLLSLRNGKAVLCEKPFGIRQQEVDAMIAMARSKRLFLMEAMWTRFFPLIHEVIEKVDSGVLGAIRTLRADFGFHALYDPESRVFKKELGGGSLMDVGIYPLFISLLLLGYPEKIEATATMRENGVDESCFLLLHYANGVKAQLYSSIVTRTGVEATIYGSKGSLTLHSRFHHPKQMSWGPYYEEKTAVSDTYEGHGYHYEIAHVNECMQKGLTESPLMTFDLSRELIRLLDAVKLEIGLQYKD